MLGIDDERHRQLFRDAVALEKAAYGDLLTEELDCQDAYELLPDKVTKFYHFAAINFPQTSYVMIADDDIYLRVDKLVKLLDGLDSTKRVYLGQAWNSVFSRASTPVREEFHKTICQWSNIP